MDAPNMTLMKSNPLVRTSSSFQLFLLDRLRQNSQPEDDSDQCGLGLGGLSDPVDDEAVWQIEDWLEQNEKDYEKMEAEEDKQTLLKIRWYLQDSAIGDIFDITEIDDLVPIEKRKSVGNTDTDITMSLTYSNVQGKELGNPYLSIFLHIIKVVRWYCKVVKLTVSNQVSSNAKLRLYSELQKRFTYVCEAFSKNYSFLEKSLNKVFKDNYPNHPVFPCFSFWRCFMRIWITDVHAAVEDELNEECLRILLRARQQHLVKCLSEADFSIAEDAAQDCQKRNPFSNSQSDLDLITVQGFLSALADISLHEASIHYMSHTRVIQGESPYLKFEDLFIHQSVSFCLAHFDLLSRNIKVFDKFLEIESSLMSQVCLNRTYSRYYDSVGVSFLRNIEEEIETIAQDGGKSNEKTIRESSAEDIKRIEMLSDIISFNKCPESKRPYETQCFDEIMCQRASSVSMEECREIANSMWGCSSPELLHVIDLYGFIESKLKGVTSKFRSNDEAVIAHNEEYGVPFDLGGAEALISLFTKLSENLLQDLIASVQPQASDDGDQFEVVSANVSYETYNELSEEEQLTDEHILIGIERTV